jgi:hypothetical protein
MEVQFVVQKITHHKQIIHAKKQIVRLIASGLGALGLLALLLAMVLTLLNKELEQERLQQ